MKYAYHGTSILNISKIKAKGLVTGAYSAYAKKYSIYDDGYHLFFSIDIKYIHESYGDIRYENITIRFPWPNDAQQDENVYGRFLENQFVSRIDILPEFIEVETEDGWIPILEIN